MSPRNIIEHANDGDMPGLQSPSTDGVEAVVTEETHSSKSPPMQIVWGNIGWMVYLHGSAIIGLFLITSVSWKTLLFSFLLYFLNALGITAGAHRLWSHRAYKARLPLKIFLMCCQTLAFQNDVIEWSRDHRAHHKYSETSADPHNANYGFFFAHMGWLLVRKHPDVKSKGKILDMSDLEEDKVLQFQRRYYLWLVMLICFIIPSLVPWYFWGESIFLAYHVAGTMRYVLSLHVTWSVNSVAHMWGNKPYDKNINPVENFFVTFGAIGEGYHNYHHTFPHDYTTSEYNWKWNPTSVFIDTMHLIGQSYDLRKMKHEIVFRRKERTGDGSFGFGHLSRRPITARITKTQ